MRKLYRIGALMGADMVLEYTFFSMQNYLTDAWKLSFTNAAAILNIWEGMYRIFSVVFVFLAETVLGNFGTLVLSAISSSVGIALVTIQTFPVFRDSTAGTCKGDEAECANNTQKLLFYMGMALLAVGRAALASGDSFAEEQKDATDESPDTISPVEVASLLFVYLTPVVGNFAFPYIKKWFVLFGVSAICTAFATLFFLRGWRAYDKVKPNGSPITDVCRVFVAAAFKISQPFPQDDEQFYVKNHDNEQVRLLSPGRSLRWLDKAAIILPGDVSREDQVKNRWRLCSVEEVEAAKIAVRMLPMGSTFIICSVISSIGNTYFMEQASHMNPKLHSMKVPLQALVLIFLCYKFFFRILASVLVRDPEIGLGPTKGIGAGMIFSVVCCVTAAGLETRRLKMIRRHSLLDDPEAKAAMSVYWLAFQFALLAGLDSFLETSVAAFYKDESPKSMKRYLDCFSEVVSGLGYMSSVLSVYVVGRISERGGRKSWFQYTLNESRLDRYYWVLSVLGSVNLLVFIAVASCYRYKNRRAGNIEGSRPSSSREVSDDEALDALGLNNSGAFIMRHLVYRNTSK